MYIDGHTLAAVAEFLNISKIARAANINENTLWSKINRGTLDSRPDYMQGIADTLAEVGIFVRRANESPLEFSSRVTEYCHKRHAEEV